MVNRPVLYWLGPELAQAGIISNEEWVPIQAAKAETMYAGDVRSNLQTAAVIVAVSGRNSLDYLEQCPIIPCTAASLSFNKFERSSWASSWKYISQNQTKLRDVMKRFMIPKPLRKIQPNEAQYTEFSFIESCCLVKPSFLAQCIPDNQYQRRHWAMRVQAFIGQYLRRGGTLPSVGVIEWVLREAKPEQNFAAFFQDIADYVLANRDTFNPAWSVRRVIQEELAWRERLSTATSEELFFARHGVAWDQDISYAPFPNVETTIKLTGNGTYQFIPLRSGKALHEEGKAMHHCVGSYFQDIRQGKSRIYSIRSNDRRLATVEYAAKPTFLIGRAWPQSHDPLPPSVSKNPRNWEINQCKGPCNEAAWNYTRVAAVEFLDKVRKTAQQNDG